MISVVVGTLNRIDLLKQSVDSILRQTRTPMRLYVTDAGSTDGTREYLESIACDRIVPIFETAKRGQARAYNDVFRIVDTPYVAWLSDDNLVVNHGLDIAVGVLQRKPRFGMVALKVRDVRGPFIDAPYIGGVSTAGVLNVNQGVVRSDLLRLVGGFSEEFRDYGIDPDLTAKILLAGHDVAYTKKVTIHHYRGWETDDNAVAFKAHRAKLDRARELYERKYGGIFQDSAGWRFKRRLVGPIRYLWARVSAPVPGEDAAHRDPTWAETNARDWVNILQGRYISVFDKLWNWPRAYYLVQHAPPAEEVRRVHSDPPLRAAARQAPSRVIVPGNDSGRAAARISPSKGA